MTVKNHHLMFKAFADPNRLRLLHILTQGERCVCDLMVVLKMGQSKVSRHLAYLRRSGLVDARRDGLWIHYSLRSAETEFQRKLLECVACCLGESPVLRHDLELLHGISQKKLESKKNHGAA